MNETTNTAVATSYSFGPTYFVAESEAALRTKVEEFAREALKYDSPEGVNVALYYHHDCRVFSIAHENGEDCAKHECVIGTDGYPDELMTVVDVSEDDYRSEYEYRYEEC